MVFRYVKKARGSTRNYDPELSTSYKARGGFVVPSDVTPPLLPPDGTRMGPGWDPDGTDSDGTRPENSPNGWWEAKQHMRSVASCASKVSSKLCLSKLIRPLTD